MPAFAILRRRQADLDHHDHDHQSAGTSDGNASGDTLPPPPPPSSSLPIPPRGMALTGAFFDSSTADAPSSSSLSSANSTLVGGGVLATTNATVDKFIEHTHTSSGMQAAGVSANALPRTVSGSPTGPNTTIIIASSVAGAVVACVVAVGLLVLYRKRNRATMHAARDRERYAKAVAAAHSTYKSGSPTPRPTAGYTVGYEARLTKALSHYPRPESLLSSSVCTDHSMVPSVMGMVAVTPNAANARQRTLATVVEQDDAPSEYSRVSIDVSSVPQWAEAMGDHVADAFPAPSVSNHYDAVFGASLASDVGGPMSSGHNSSIGGRRPSLYEGVSWPRRGRLNTGTEIHGMM